MVLLALFDFSGSRNNDCRHLQYPEQWLFLGDIQNEPASASARSKLSFIMPVPDSPPLSDEVDEQIDYWYSNNIVSVF